MTVDHEMQRIVSLAAGIILGFVLVQLLFLAATCIRSRRDTREHRETFKRLRSLLHPSARKSGGRP